MPSLEKSEGLERLLQPNRPGDPVWIKVGQLFDGESLYPGGGAHVVFDRQSIRHVARADEPPARELLRPGQSEPDADLPGFTLLPGLTEAHAHLFLQGGELLTELRGSQQAQPPAALLESARSRLRTLLELGVMAVRDAGDRDGVGLALSAEYRAPGRPIMPYIDSPGAAIHRRGRYGSFMSRPLEEHDSLEACVRARIAEGARRIKIISSGIINFKTGSVTSPPQLDAGQIRQVTGEARLHGLQTFAHASGADSIENATLGGVDSIEHGFFVTPDQLRRIRDAGIAWVPTFVPVKTQVDHAELLGWDQGVVDRLRRVLDGHARSLAAAEAMGVQILAGSDAGSQGVAHGLGLLEELEILESCGLAPRAALRAATGAPAARLGFPELIGTIRAGARARMILTREDPLQTVASLRREKWCLFDGEVLHVDPGSHETSHL